MHAPRVAVPLTRLASSASPRALRARARRCMAAAAGAPPGGAAQLAERLVSAFVEPYLEANPSAAKGLALLRGASCDIHFDHFAFRSFGVDGLGIDAAARVWLDLGYTRRDQLLFPAKKLRAYWFAPPAPPEEQEPRLPRVFISEVDVSALSARARTVVARAVAPAAPLAAHAALWGALRAPPWGAASREDYEALAAESEYAAWTLVNGFALNHTTVAVHRLAPPGSPARRLEDVNALMAQQGLALNGEGGVVKTSHGLRQSSTVADTWRCAFACGAAARVPGAYLEFAERAVLPQFAQLPPGDVREHHRRDGFEVSNADGIFESTSSRQVQGGR